MRNGKRTVTELEAELEDAYHRIEELEDHIRDGATLLSDDDLDEVLEDVEAQEEEETES